MLSLDNHFRSNSERRYKKLTLVALALMVVIFSPYSFSAECQELFYTHSGADGSRPYKAYYIDTGLASSVCDKSLSLDSLEYARLSAFEEQAITGSNQFDPVAYDMGLYGIIKMFVAGIGIGAIIGYLSKLRR